MAATWASTLQATMVDELEDEESVHQVLEHAHHHPYGRIIKKDIRPWYESAPDPLITSTLQQQASQLFHCSPKQTMSIAQRLYEAGHITYMRTDKAVMAEEAKEQARTWVRTNLGEEYVALLPSPPSLPSEPAKKMRRPKTQQTQQTQEPKAHAKAQEAHEAIRPTHLDVTELPSSEWGPTERRLYQLISRRALQSVMAPAHGERCLVTVLLDGLDDFPWMSQDTRTLFEGWKRLGQVASMDSSEEDKKEEDKKEHSAPSWDTWTVGLELAWTAMKGIEKETAAQGRFTEASLVRELEKHGIGRPSTFASLLSVLQDKGYVLLRDLPPTPITLHTHELLPHQWPPTPHTRQHLRGAEKRKLVPTPLGRSVWEWLSQNIEELFAYPFTATMERQLDAIAEGRGEEKNLLQSVWGSYRERYHTLLSASSSSSSSSSSASSSSSSSASSASSSSSASTASLKQKVFKNGLKAVQTKKGPLLLREGATKEQTEFFGWPASLSWDKMTEQKANEYIQVLSQEKEGVLVGQYEDQPILKKKGQYGAYLRWKSVTVPFVEGEAIEATIERFQKKAEASSSASPTQPSLLKETPHHIIRMGPYAPYIMKKQTTKTKTKAMFVSVPKGMDIASLTEKEVDALYKAGVEAKKTRLSQGGSF
jgi:DNA topoisomerase-1